MFLNLDLSDHFLLVRVSLNILAEDPTNVVVSFQNHITRHNVLHLVIWLSVCHCLVFSHYFSSAFPASFTKRFILLTFYSPKICNFYLPFNTLKSNFYLTFIVLLCDTVLWMLLLFLVTRLLREDRVKPFVFPFFASSATVYEYCMCVRVSVYLKLFTVPLPPSHLALCLVFSGQGSHGTDSHGKDIFFF